MNWIKKLNDKIEEVLWKKGFPRGATRDALRIVTLLSLLFAVLGLVFLPLTAHIFWIGFGALLAVWNFYSMAHFVQHNLPLFAQSTTGNSQRKIFCAGQLARSYFRLFITGILLYGALVVCEANVFALTAGLSLVVVVIPLAALLRKRQGKN